MKLEKHGHQLSKIEIIFILLVFLSLIGVGLFALSSSRDKEASVSDFESCVAAGNSVMMSYPEQCGANGQVFVNPSHSTIRPN